MVQPQNVLVIFINVEKIWILNPLFQLSTRSYDKEILIVKQALANLETECNVKNGYTIEKPFNKFVLKFFNIQISEDLTEIIE